MLTLKSLIFSAIGRFVEEQTIDFTQLGSFVEVGGQNNNTGGSSGSAKSTVFRALEFNLGVNDLPTSILQSRLTKNPIYTKGIYDLDGIPVIIERGKKLLIDLNGEVTTGSSKLTEEKLDEIIGMPRDLFRKILHKRQGEGGFFLDMGPSDVHKFLTNCLGLEKEQAKIITLDARINFLTDSETFLKSVIESNRTGLEATNNATHSLGPEPILEVGPEAVEKLKTKYLEATETLKSIQGVQKKEIEDLEKSRPQITTIPFDRSKIEQLESEISDIGTKIAQLEKIELSRQSNEKAKISELKIQMAKFVSDEQIRQSEVKSKIASIQASILRFQQEEQNRQNEVCSKLNSNKFEITKALEIVKDGNRAKNEATGLAKELQKIRASICPTCEQGWVNDAAKTKEVGIISKLQEHKKMVIAGIEASNRILILEEERKKLDLEALPISVPEIEILNVQIEQLKEDSKPKRIPEIDAASLLIDQHTLNSFPQAISEAIEFKLKIDFKNQELAAIRQEERDHQFKENAKSQAILVEFAQKQTELKKCHDFALKSAQDNEYGNLSAYNTVLNQLKSFEDNKNRYFESFNRLLEQGNKYQHQLTTKCLELLLVQEEIELANESKKVIKSYLSCSFEDALDSIGDAATRLIRAIPNMATATIQFEGLKETKEGKIKEEVTCMVSMDGEIGVPLKSLSGGERSSCDMCIDLSVIKFIEERTGKGIDLYIIDEGFNGLDTTCIQDALEMLRNCSVDKRLFLVEHNPIVSQSIENRLIVVRDGLTSKIVHQ